MLNYDKHKEEIDKIFKDGKSLCEVNQTFIIVIATKDSLEAVAIPDMPFEGMKLEREYSLEELGL